MEKSRGGLKVLEPKAETKVEAKEVKTEPKQEIKIELKQEVQPEILDEVSNFIFVSKYARYNDKLKRRETWEEAVDRLYKMHAKKYHFLSPEDQIEVKQCFDMIRQKRVVPAMRSMQFGGKAIEQKHEKLFNCSARHIDSIRSFAETMFLLLNGCGVGVGLSKYFLNRLPNLVNADDKTGTVITYVIEDTIEGWADSIEILLNCYFKNTPCTGRKIVFDYCVHPDTKVLKSDLSWELAKNLKPDDRLICFDEHNPTNKGQNNRRYIREGKIIKNKRIIRPCYKIKTDRGEVICSQEHRWLAKIDYYTNKKLTGKKHESYEWQETKNLKVGDKIAFATEPWNVDISSNESGYMAGLLDGEGWISKTTCGISQNANGIVAEQIENILKKNNIKYNVSSYQRKRKNKPSNIMNSWRSINKWEAMKIVGIFRPKRLMQKSRDLWENNAHVTGKGHIPAIIQSIEFIGDQEVIALETDKATFIANGFLSHNSKIRKKGSPLKISGGKAPGYKGLKAAHSKIKALLDHIIEELGQNRLKSINAYDIIMHCSDAVLSGGVRRSATSVIFEKDDLDMLNAKTYFKVEKKKRFSFDKETNKHYGSVQVGKKIYEVELDEYNWNILEKENKISWLWVEPQRARSNNSVLLLRDTTTEAELIEIMKKTREFGEPGFVFANHPWQLFNPCMEISFIPVTEGGVCGVQFCNLTSINGARVKTKEDYKACVKAATIIGTLQAGYTHFPYLSNAAKELSEAEALLGVSITGMMDSPEILLNPENQKEMAEFAVATNVIWAKKIGINPAARVTCVKPEGSSSLVLGCASGIHAHHAKKYFRRVQCNKTENPYKFFKKHNPHLCEESLWSANKTDDVITFPLEIKHDCMVKKDLTAIKHLEIVKSTQQNWVNTGTTKANKKPVNHNVSCTVIVENHEWDEVAEYIYKHRSSFSAVSFLHSCGDKSYMQAPMEAVTTSEDEAKFADMVAKYKHVDYTKLTEDDDETQLQQEMVCAGGQCEIR